jgi:hypothetical protein
MIGLVFREIFRHFHLPLWIPFAFWFGLYIIAASVFIINGYSRELFGTGLYHIGRIHKVLFHLHTGRHIRGGHSYGDERDLWRTARPNYRTTPGGQTVYYHAWSRGLRALRNNTIVVLILCMMAGMDIDPRSTVIALTLLSWCAAMAWIAVKVRSARAKRDRARPAQFRPVQFRPSFRVASPAAAVVPDATPKVTAEDRPQLAGAPKSTIATLLAGEMGCSPAEISERMTLTSQQGAVRLPDAYPAKPKQQEAVEEVISVHTKGKIGFSWNTTQTPRTLTWHPVKINSLPSYARFRDYLDELEKLGPREFGVGPKDDGSVYVSSHNGDFPLHCRSAGPGTGKTTGFMIKAAQICHKDPEADLYCVDTKQVSFDPLRDIPGVYVFDNPMTEMDEIWKVFYTIYGLMRDRYAAKQQKRRSFVDFNDIWMLVDEGNDLASTLKSYSKNVLKDGATASVWGEAVGPIMRMGRECRIFGEWMFQDLDGRMFGGETLKTAFSLFGMAGFSEQQLKRIIGPPGEECLEGPGRILMCKGNKREWVQGFHDDIDFLYEYALVNRKGRKK